MLKNYLLLAVKNFRKQKLFSLINILGLTVGITCCLLIFLFVTNEYSYDNFHKNGKNIYRLMRTGIIDNAAREIPFVSPPYATALTNEYPEAVQKTMRVFYDNDLVTYNNISFNEKKAILADSNFFSFFSFKLVKGDPATVLNDPLSIVMTESVAKKYFGNEDPIGKVIDLNKKMKMTVTGIAADVPANSHIDFDIILPIANWRNEDWFKEWRYNNSHIYVQLNPAVNPEQFKKQLPAFMEKHLGNFYRESGYAFGLTIKPLRGIYFEEGSTFDRAKHGSRKMTYIFTSIALLILFIACINFMNLATARATDRSKEVGLRKVLGALRKQLAWQFIFESLLYATIATALAFITLQLLLPTYNRFLGYELPAYWKNPYLYFFTTSIIVVVGLLAGSYPALLLSSFKPIESLKGKLKVGKHGAFFRKALVVFQFAVSVLLIVSITVVIKQMHYVRNTDLGFDKERSMIVRIDNNTIWNNKNRFKQQLMTDAAVAEVATMSGEPGGFHDKQTFEVQGKPNEKSLFNTEYADFEYVKTLGLKLIAGRDFSPSYPTDSTQSVLINRTAARQLGYTPEQAVGTWVKNFMTDKHPRTIVGVVEDYHFTSLKEAIAPLIISTQQDDRRLLLIKLRPANLPQTIARIDKIYKQLDPDHPFEYQFLDERFNMLYRSESKQETLLSIFSVVAICIACLGLFGLASYTALKRTKEIGVRKVLGSSVENIVLLLSKDLLKPVLLGTIIAVPIGYYAMQQWLQGFVYRTSLHWWLFPLAGIIAVSIALLTVWAQAIRAAIVNPIKSLRTE